MVELKGLGIQEETELEVRYPPGPGVLAPTCLVETCGDIASPYLRGCQWIPRDRTWDMTRHDPKRKEQIPQPTTGTKTTVGRLETCFLRPGDRRNLAPFERLRVSSLS